MFVKFSKEGVAVVIDSDCIICAEPSANGSKISVMIGDKEKILSVEETTEEIYNELISIEKEY